MTKHMESTTKFIKRKVSVAGSVVYRSLVFPFVRMRIERKTNSILNKGVYLRGGTSLKGKDYICEGAELDNVHVGFSTMIGRGAIMSNTRIGNFSCIGNVETFIGKHPVKGENLSVHPAFYSTAAQFGHTYVAETSYKEADYIDESKGIQIEIGNDVWIGYGVKICEGVTIGDGAVVGAGSIVTKSIEPYAIYAGVPAKRIGQRFDDEMISKLLELKWWDKDEAWIKEHAKEFANPDNIDSLSNSNT